MTGQNNFIEYLSRCFRSFCPVCGKGKLFIPYGDVKEIRDLFLPPKYCDQCKFEFRREPGYYFGVLAPCLSVLSILFGIFIGLISFFIFHFEMIDVVWSCLFGLFLGVFIFFRTSIAIFIAIDHSIDPPS